MGNQNKNRIMTKPNYYVHELGVLKLDFACAVRLNYISILSLKNANWTAPAWAGVHWLCACAVHICPKTGLCSCLHPTKTLIRLRICQVWSESVVIHMKFLCILGYPQYIWKDWSDCGNVQADLKLRWTHMFEGTFSDVATQFSLLSGCNAVNVKNIFAIVINLSYMYTRARARARALVCVCCPIVRYN